MRTNSALFLLLLSFCVQAQTPANSVSTLVMQWKSSAFIDETTNDRVEATNNFIIDKSSTIEWNQATEDAKQLFIIKSVDNQWVDINSDGYVKYVFDCYNTEGTLTIRRKTGLLTVSLEIRGLPSGDLSLLFEVVEIIY